MGFSGRVAELTLLDQLLTAAVSGAGGLLVIVGGRGSGKTALLAEAAAAGRRRGLVVLGGSASVGSPGRSVWARLLREVGAPDDLADRVLDRPRPADRDAAARCLAHADRHLLLVDDIDRGGPGPLELLLSLAGRLLVGSCAVVVTASSPLGIGPEVRLGALTEDELGAVIGAGPGDLRHAVWVASGGIPGVARSLAGQLADLPPEEDPLLHLALQARSSVRFLDVDIGVVRLLEAALERAGSGVVRARLLARLARELLGDASEGARRRALADEALALARRDGDRQTLAAVLDARLHALWDPAGARDRLDAAVEIVELARASGDPALERSGLFWRFVALMELGRIMEAESALAAFARAARAAGDAEALAMVTARQAMLATLRGRFDDAVRLIDDVAEEGRRVRMADTEALVGTLRGAVIMLREDRSGAAAGLEPLTLAARHLPGNLFEASVARVLVLLGRLPEASAELERILPQVLSGSGPRWIGAVADLSVVAAATGNRDATGRLYEALLPYRGRLVIWGGANTVTGPVEHYLGLLVTELGRLDEAVELLSEATALERRIGALPWLAHSTAALADALGQRGRDGDAVLAADCRRRARLAAQRLDLPGLSARLDPPADEWTLRRDAGGDWLLEAGSERAQLRDSRGLHHLRALLATPRVDVPALDLAAGGAGLAAPATAPVLDEAAVRAYRSRLASIDAALDAADRSGSSEAAARAYADRDALVRELRRASGLGGRVRRTSGEAERARVNVTRTLRATLDRLAEVAPRAAGHLKASIHTGLSCRYDPAPGGPTRWHV